MQEFHIEYKKIPATIIQISLAMKLPPSVSSSKGHAVLDTPLPFNLNHNKKQHF
jgi:hypothetical protein